GAQCELQGAPVVDDPALQRGGHGEVGAGRRVEVAVVVLDVPVVGVGQHRQQQVLPVRDRPVQADQVADVGVDADVGQADLADQADRALRGAEVGVLVHLQGEAESVPGRAFAQGAQAPHGQGPGAFVAGRVGGAGLVPEPQCAALRLGQRPVQADGDHRGAEFGGGVDGAQQVVEVVPGYGRVGVDHAAPDGGDRGQAEPVLLEGAGQFGQPAGGQVARAQPAVGEVDVVEALGGDLAE